MQTGTVTDAARAHDARDRMLAVELKICRAKYKTSGGDPHARADLLKELERNFGRSFGVGTSIVVDLDSFGYVQGTNRTAALKAFVARFGVTASGWAFDIGKPMSIGGGACPM